MIIAGAGGHAVEVLGILEENGFSGPIGFFDDVNHYDSRLRLGRYKIISSAGELTRWFATDPGFIIGVGKPAIRKLLFDKLTAAGGSVQSAISPFAHIGKNDIRLGEGLNIMTGAVITVSSIIGRGTLVNTHCSIHHDTEIGEFCELSPGCRVLGHARIGSFTAVGAGALILPGIRVGDNVVIGAGAVVTKDILDGDRVAGVPAKKII